MKKIIILLMIATISFCSCSDDDDKYIYNMPGFSIEDYMDLLGSSVDDFNEDYPYNVVNDGYYNSFKAEELLINTYLKNDEEKKSLNTYVYFKDDICDGLKIYNHWNNNGESNEEMYSKALDIAMLFAEDFDRIGNIDNNISASYGDGVQSHSATFNNFQEYKTWYDNELPEGQYVYNFYGYWRYGESTGGIKSSDEGTILRIYLYGNNKREYGSYHIRIGEEYND